MDKIGQTDFLLSVIVPVYNCEKYLIGTIGSILKQTYRNLEVILIDDGSADSSGELCDFLALEDERVRVIHQENQGPSAARNAALDICQGEYIHFHDSDDWLEKDAYEKIINKMIEEGCDVAFFGWYTDSAFGQKEMAHKAYSGTGDRHLLLREMLVPVGKIGRYAGYGNYLWNKLFKRTAIFSEDQVCLFDENLHVAEDGIWLLEAAINWRKGLFYPQPLYHYRINSQSIMNNDKNYFRTRAASQRAHLRMLRMAKNYDPSLYEIHRETCNDFFWHLVTVGIQKKNFNFTRDTLTRMFQANGNRCPHILVEQLNDLARLKNEQRSKEVQLAIKVRRVRWRIRNKGKRANDRIKKSLQLMRPKRVVWLVKKNLKKKIIWVAKRNMKKVVWVVREKKTLWAFKKVTKKILRKLKIVFKRPAT